MGTPIFWYVAYPHHAFNSLPALEILPVDHPKLQDRQCVPQRAVKTVWLAVMKTSCTTVH